MKSSIFARWPVILLGCAALVLPASCNTAGELPQGPVTPIVPPPGAVATRSAQPTSPPIVETAPVTTQPTAVSPTAVTPPTSQPSPQSTSQASIAGTLVNGTPGGKSPGNLPLTLYALSPDGSSIMFTRTTLSDAGGQFVFDKLDASTPIMYAVQTVYLKGTYTSDPLTLAHGSLTVTVPITVYETTTDASGLSVEQMHMFFDFVPGKTTVGQLFIASNSSDRAYIGSDSTSLHLPLPPGATNVRFQDGELGGRYQSVSGGFADTDAVPPGTGTAQILVSYDLPYDGRKLDINLPMSYPVKNVNILVAEGGVKVTSPQLTEAGTRQTQAGNMLNYVGGNLAAGSSLALRLSGAALPAPSGDTTSSKSAPPVLIISAALLLVAVGIVAFVWLRQQRHAGELVEEEVEDVQARQDELLDAIAALDDDFEAGRVKEADYRRQRAELKTELAEWMKDE